MFRCLFSCLALLALPLSAAELPIIPQPSSVVEKNGTLQLASGAAVAVSGSSHGTFLLESLIQASDWKFTPAPASAPAAVLFTKVSAQGKSPEAYQLEITATGIRITGDEAGLFYGAQSLAQLIANSSEKGTDAVTLPEVLIDDTPRFKWRGYMLDESRHFSGEATVKRLLDAMAYYKLNRLHWHLTDSPAWRIEIKKYPKLTSIGGRGSESDQSPDAPAQFYTQEQIRDIVAYAQARHIVIIPEIDMPGHADAAVRAYPEHDGGGYSSSGSKIKWPRFTFNPAKPETLTFLDNILKEVAGLFPNAEVLHFGGDEVHFGWKKWPHLPEVQELMKKENLKDNAAVEAWFNRRMAGVINQLGFKVGGWDEIAARKLATDKTVIFWWRHDRPQVMRRALADGYPVVLCPRRPLYLDFVQANEHKVGRRWNGFNPLADVYDFPAKLKLNAKQEAGVLGIQANIWTEGMRDQERRDFMTWPRLVAVAEAGWTPAQRKDYASFEKRLQPELARLQARGFTIYDPFTNSPEVRDRKETKTDAPLDQPK